MSKAKGKVKEALLKLWSSIKDAARELLHFLVEGIPGLVRFLVSQLCQHKVRLHSVLKMLCFTVGIHLLGAAALVSKGLYQDACVYAVEAIWLLPVSGVIGLLVCVFGADSLLYAAVQTLIVCGLSVQTALDPGNAAALIAQYYIGACAGALGAIGYAYFARLDGDSLISLLNSASLACYGLLLVSPASHGTRAWVSIGGVNFQLTEITKLLATIAVARAATEPETTDRDRTARVFRILAFHAVALALLNEIATALILCLCGGIILFLSIRQLRWVVCWTGVAGGGGYAAWLICKLCAQLGGKGPLRVGMLIYHKACARLGGTGDNYQSDMARKALLLSGWFGTDTQQKVNVPAASTDFAAVALAQDFGVVAVLGVLVLLFGMLLTALVTLGKKEQVFFPDILAMSTILLVEAQAVLNLVSVTGIGAVIGVGFPLISLGGTNVVFICTCVGMALAASSDMDIREELPFKN